jgi:AraC-like DNA-binding protein
VSPGEDDTRGIVRAGAGFERFRLTRHRPRPELEWAVDRYWIVRWDVPGGEPYEQKVVPHPASHLVFEGGRAEVEAISRHDFVRRLEGRGHVLGVKFRPAGFRPFLGRAVATVAGQRLAADAIPAFAGRTAAVVDDLAGRLAADDDVDALVPEVDDLLLSLGVEPLPMTEAINALVDHIGRDRTLVRVDDLARRLGTSTRRLQRLFAEHVGLGPKWVINRCRILEAAERAANATPEAEAPLDWAALAVELGYSDQSHLVRDFTAAVGTPPDRYARESQPGA